MNKLSLFNLTNEQKKKLPIWYAVELFFMAAYLAFDLLTKKYIYDPMAKGADDVILIKGVLRFTPVENTGASFGIFSDSTQVLTIISLITAIILFFVWMLTITERNGWLRSALVLIIAGALGNIVDRLSFGYVRDFVYFELINFAVFNFADSGLCIGAGLLIIYLLVYYVKADTKSAKGKHDREVDR